MSLQDKLKPIIRYLKIASLCGSGGLFIAYQIGQTYGLMQKIVNTSVLEREKKYTPEYIYINDPTYSAKVQLEHDRQTKQAVGFARIWKSLKHSLAWRLLWLCRHGTREQRNVALEQLAAFKNNKSWDCLKLAQAMDPTTAVLLARTRGADLRYFLPPPIHVRRAALTPQLVSFKLKSLIVTAQSVNPHSCIEHFLSKYFANIQEQASEVDIVITKPDTISERDLCIQCLDALHHHISLFHSKDYEEDASSAALIKKGLLPVLSEIMLRFKNDVDIDLGILRILTVLTIHSHLLNDFFQNGIIGELTRLLRSKDVRLSSSAAVCLTNLSGECCYRPGLYLLHPLYRTTSPQICDTLLVHGLRGGVFVTWRQRDKKCAEPLGIIEVTMSENDCDTCEETPTGPTYLDPELRQVMADLIEFDEEGLVAEYDLVLHDIPIEAKRESPAQQYTTCIRNRQALIEEEEDRCNHTYCWPKDWLPKDCGNLRILGINYWSSLSEWLERCPLQTADIATRSADIAPMLLDAGVGLKNIPVVWLAHSMGGLIVKQLLIDACNSKEEDFTRLSDNTKAIIFYSTPHLGSSLATMPRAAAAVLWPSNDVRQLQENSPTLLQLHSMFLEKADRYGWETISFAESQPTLITAFKVPVHFVQSFSADLGRGVFYQLPLDHLSICKPATRQSILYTSVLDVIQRVTAKHIELKYYNPYIQYIMDTIWWALSKKAKKVLEAIDEGSQNSDELKWFEKILLNAFTDGFTD